MKIIGAGLSGLLAGALTPGSIIYEKQNELPNNHGALLRFRSDKIAKALNIPFKRVLVTKAIWYNGIEVQPTPRFQNLYSKKCLGVLSTRSIRDISPVYRYIAPYNLINQLEKRCNIEYGYDWDGRPMYNSATVSTIPMPYTIKLVLEENPNDHADFRRQPIWTRKYYFGEEVDIYQTIYFPGIETSIYRASFTGNILIVEMIKDPERVDVDFDILSAAFGHDVYGDYSRTQRDSFGKIAEIDNTVRRSIMAQLTHEYNIYSLGRFATWRNILLDDVFDDIFKIQDLMRLDDYSKRIAIAEELI